MATLNRVTEYFGPQFVWEGNTIHPYSIFWVTDQYEDFVCDFSIANTIDYVTPNNPYGGYSGFTAQYMPFIMLALNAKKDWILHSIVNKIGSLVNQNIFVCSREVLISDLSKSRSLGYKEFTDHGTPKVFPSNVTNNNHPVLLTRSNKITAIYRNEKQKRTYILGDFRYEVLGGLPLTDIQKKVVVSATPGNIDKGSGFFQYDRSFVTLIYENIVCLDDNGKIMIDFLPRYKMINGSEVDGGGVVINDEAYAVIGFDRLTKNFYRADEGDILIGGKFTGYLKKIDKFGKELSTNDFNLDFTLNGPIYTIDIDYSIEPPNNAQGIRKLTNIDIYIGGNFTIAGSPNNNYMTRLKNNGAHNPIIMVSGVDLGLNNTVKCIKILRYHKDINNNTIIMIGGKFTAMNSLTITKCAKIIRYESGPNIGLHEFIDSFRPIYDSDDDSVVNTIAEYSESTWDYMIIGGKFTNAGSYQPNVRNICRILITDGSFDPQFSLGSSDPFKLIQDNLGADGTINNIVFWDSLVIPTFDLDPNIYLKPWEYPKNAYIYVAGSFSKYGNEEKNVKLYLVRLFVEPNYKSTQHFNLWRN